MEAAEVVVERPAIAVDASARRDPTTQSADLSSGYRWARARQAFLSALPVFAADLLAAAVSVTVATYLTFERFPPPNAEWLAFLLGIAAAALLCHAAVNLYPGVGLSLIAEARRASLAAVYLFAGYLFIGWGADRLQLPTGVVLLTTCCLMMVLVPLARALARSAASRTVWWPQPAVVLGAEEDVEALSGFLARHRRLGLRPVAAVTDDDIAESEACGEESVLEQRAEWFIGHGPLLWLVAARSSRSLAKVRGAAADLGLSTANRFLIADWKAQPTFWNRADGRLDWLQFQHRLPATITGSAKRCVDFVLSAVGGVCILPLLLLIVVLIKWQSPGPAFYCQERIGRHGRRFRVWKFRTMIQDADRVLADFLANSPERQEEWNRTHKLQDDPRITAIGRLLRKTSLDELPQVWNVLRGEMSLVGPRPIVSAEIVKYEDRFSDYCRVLPGITGLWQVSGRSDTTYAERVALDSYYARHYSSWLDIYILLMTVRVVLFRQGAY